MKRFKDLEVFIFDWGNTLMYDIPQYSGPMARWSHIEVVPGVEELLGFLSDDYICCVASNAESSCKKLLREALSRGGIEKYFDYFFTPAEIGCKKPELRYYQAIIDRLGISPSACVMIGDDYEKDIEPAKDVGMWTFYFAQEEKRRVYKADYVFKCMGQLLNFLKNC